MEERVRREERQRFEGLDRTSPTVCLEVRDEGGESIETLGIELAEAIGSSEGR